MGKWIDQNLIAAMCIAAPVGAFMGWLVCKLLSRIYHWE
jgi:hypothetical protein